MSVYNYQISSNRSHKLIESTLKCLKRVQNLSSDEPEN